MLTVVDTNVLVSAATFPRSLPFEAVLLASSKGIILFSRDTLDEFHEVIFRKKFDRYITVDERQRFFNAITEDAKIMDSRDEVIACRDPDDDKFLSLAVTGNADTIVTGDADLLVLHPFRGVAILTPQQFVDQFANR